MNRLWTSSGLRLGRCTTAAPQPGEKPGCSHRDQPDPSEWNYNRFCWDKRIKHPEGIDGMLDNCLIWSLTSRSGNGQQLLPAPEHGASPVIWVFSLCGCHTQEGLCDSSHVFLGRQLYIEPKFLHASVTDWCWAASPGEDRGTGKGKGSRVYLRSCVCRHTCIHKQIQTYTHAHTTHRALPHFCLLFYIPLCHMFSGSSDHHAGQLVWICHIPDGADWRLCGE